MVLLREERPLLAGLAASVVLVKPQLAWGVPLVSLVAGNGAPSPASPSAPPPGPPVRWRWPRPPASVGSPPTWEWWPVR
jgi:hypothetical protein